MKQAIIMKKILEETSLRIISNVGMAKSLYIQAIEKAKTGQIEEAKDLLIEGKKYYIEGHKAHSEILRKEASGEKLDLNLLLVHSENHLSSTEIMEYISNQVIFLYKVLTDNKLNIKEEI